MPLLPWSPLRNILKILKSSLSPGQIALGFALGMFAGLPPPGLHLLLPLTAALLLRVSFKAFLLSWGLFELLSFPLAPASYAVGRALLENETLYPFWRFVTHLPVLAPMGYSRYLLGSYVLALGLAVPLFLLVRYLVFKYRHSFSAWLASRGGLRRLRGKPLVRFLNWLFLGGEAKYETARPPWGPSATFAKKP
ncbi:TIGR03546 family protein [Candidatus Bipolaricaulota bacterium]|nr:TIGR03546 family protein [Candidatus Bipolaricaulota bacterium]